MEYVVQDPAINMSSSLLGRPFLKRSIKHYSNSHLILLVGEGDFSFSLALANAFGSAENMVPTSLDSKDKVLQFYESAHTTLSNLEGLGATILHGVDVTTMEKHDTLRRMRFHRIVYNFPHAGFHGKEEDTKVIKKHRHLLKMFFKNARTLLSENGEIHVTHKEFGPYQKWELVKQAKECGLLLKESVRFRITDYPGYTNRRGAGPNAGDSFVLGKCQTYKFALGPELLYKRESLAIPVISPTVSSEASTENLKGVLWEPELEGQMRTADEMAVLWEREPEGQMSMEGEITALWKPEPEKQMRMAGEMAKAEEINKSDEFAWERNAALNLKGDHDAVKTKKSLEEALLELEFERQTKMAAETAKADLETSFNHLKMTLKMELNKNYELKRQIDRVLRQRDEACRGKTDIAKRLDEAYAERNDALHQQSKAWREKEKVAKQLSEVLRLNEDAVKQKDTEIEIERQARKSAEAAKTNLETAFNRVMVSLNTELKKNYELKRQRDEAVRLMEQACREKSRIAQQLDEALSFKNPNDIISYVTVASSGLAIALYLFRKCRAK